MYLSQFEEKWKSPDFDSFSGDLNLKFEGFENKTGWSIKNVSIGCPIQNYHCQTIIKMQYGPNEEK